MDLLTKSLSGVRKMRTQLGLRSERAMAFLFDYIYYYGASPLTVPNLPALKRAFVAAVGRMPDEQEALLILANVLRPQWQKRERALVFALGRGKINGTGIDLEAAGLGMRDFETGKPIPLVEDASVLERLVEGWVPQRANSSKR